MLRVTELAQQDRICTQFPLMPKWRLKLIPQMTLSWESELNAQKGSDLRGGDARCQSYKLTRG